MTVCLLNEGYQTLSCQMSLTLFGRGTNFSSSPSRSTFAAAAADFFLFGPILSAKICKIKNLKWSEFSVRLHFCNLEFVLLELCSEGLDLLDLLGLHLVGVEVLELDHLPLLPTVLLPADLDLLLLLLSCLLSLPSLNRAAMIKIFTHNKLQIGYTHIHITHC